MIQCSAVSITNLRSENNFEIVIIDANHPFLPFYINGKSRLFFKVARNCQYYKTNLSKLTQCIKPMLYPQGYLIEDFKEADHPIKIL